MTTENPALVLRGLKDLRLEQKPIPEPGPKEVLIAVHSVGICGTDLHQWNDGRVLGHVVTKEHVLGHEASGTVVKIGDGVTNVKKGDRVAIEPTVACLSCTFCKSGNYNVCQEMKLASLPPFTGTLSRYFLHSASFCHKIPDNVSLEEAAIVEPLSVAIRSCQRANVTSGKTVLVTGAGPIGLLTMLTAKAMGASKIYVADVLQNRLDFAKSQGADGTILFDKKDANNLSKIVLKEIGEPVDIVLECTGVELCVHLALLVVKPAGVVQLTGLGNRMMNLPIMDVIEKEIDIRGSFCYVNCQPIAISMISSGKVNVKPLITHRFDLVDGAKAFELAHSRQENPIKVIINCAN